MIGANMSAGSVDVVTDWRMAATPARTRAGLAIKLRVLASLYGNDLEAPVEDGGADPFADMLRSIFADVAGESV